MITSRQRLKLAGMACEIVGNVGEEPDIVLLHGWGCDQETLRPQIGCLSSVSRVVAPDLPGFGVSAPIANPTVPRLAECVLQLLSDLGGRQAIVIGHSMGGLIGLEMSRQASDTVESLIIIDSLLYNSNESRTNISNIYDLLHNNKYDEALVKTKRVLFTPHDDTSVIKLFEQTYKAANREALAASFRAHLIDYDPDPAIAALKCPFAYIATDSALTSLSKLESKVNQISIGKVIGSGHFAPLLVPQQINAMILQFISLNSSFD